MRCSNCGTENDERNLNCSNCGADLFNQDKKNVFKNKKFLISIVSLSALIMIGLIIVINSVVIPNQAADKMHKAFESKTGANVITVFEEYCGSVSVDYFALSKSGKAVFSEFKTCVDNAKEDLNSQPVETDINKYLSEAMNDIILPQEYSAITTIGEYNAQLNDVVADYYDLYNSKISYQKGIELFNKNDFSGAANSFSKVSEEDTWYDDAQNKLTESQEKLLEEKIKEIEQYLADGDYDSAQSAINELRNEELADEINKKLDEYETKIYESKLAKIDEYVSSGDMDAAKAYIESLGDGLSNEAQARLNQAIKNKANDYITKADDALKSGERQGAYDMALMAQNLCPDDNEINKKVEYFKEYLPFELYLEKNTLQVADYVRNGMGGLELKGKSYIANDSSEQKNCLNIVSYFEQKMAYCQYNLNCEYNNISGKAFIPKETKNYNQKGYFIIYGDGKKLYTSKNIMASTLPFDFNINVSNINILKIEFYNDKDFYCNYGISNFIATKNLP